MSTVKVERKALERALALANMVTPRKTTIPSITSVRIVANGDVQLAATDLELSAVLSIPRLETGEKVTACLPTGRLFSYVRARSADTLTLTPHGKPADAAVKLDDAASIVGMDPADFPAIPEARKQVVAKLPVAELVRAYKHVRYAVSTEIVRYSLTGVLLDARKKRNRVRLAASDGKRLAFTALEGATVSEDVRITLPLKVLEVLSRAVRKAKGNVELCKPEETSVQFRLPSKAGRLSTRLIEGTFPDYEAVTPKNTEGEWEIDRLALIEAIKSVKQWVGEKSCAVRFTFGGGLLKLFARDSNIGQGEVEIPVYDSRPLELVAVYNPDYVLDFLQGCGKGVETVTMKAKDKSSAALWSGPSDLRYVLMPLTVVL